ncbi:MAG: glycosyltransferase [Dysgonamonadaceae bacterium]|jgi:glycosyltransferase involved in cell wall biosynthesis/predicted metal-dependent phosphoesterase TrpH|nr:glycosyltransferase [Dysgonamonadaceae bacterium]
MNIHFQEELKTELDRFLTAQESRFDSDNTLKIDLHCHDYNSDVPDELIGRILRVPETWVSSERLIEELEKNGCDALTITNHNNARSCYIQQDRGVDVLTAAEFSCLVPDFNIGIHVLTYGFTPEQEVRLNKLRKNIYSFQEYARQHNIPTVWAHPLYHYSVKKMPPKEFFDKMLLLFERFETLNGQRDSWQNMLVREWTGQVNNEIIDLYAKKFGIDPTVYCVNPYKKSLTGGSDSHTGIFAGLTGSYLYLPDLQNRLKTTARSALALEAIRSGDIAPFGAHQNTEKLTITFLNYVCQIALNYRDPGLVRMLLHKGDMQDKIISLFASNVFSEVQKHKVTMSFVRLFYNCMMGEKPPFFKKLLLPSHYRPVFDEAVKIAEAGGENMDAEYYRSILSINSQINRLLAERLAGKIANLHIEEKTGKLSLESVIEDLELPSSIRYYVDRKENGASIDISKFLDGLSFPFFASLFILAAHFTSAKTMFNTRPFLRKFSRQLGKFEPPKRILWLTDTFGDKNGVSMFLQQMHRQIKERSLPIDIITCSSTVQPDSNLIALKPVSEFEIPFYREQNICIPNFVELHNLFLKGEYDRIICSTEGIMGMCALYLKHAYSVEASFYMHTDWLMFARKVLNITGHNLDRVRRLLRFFYKSFDRVLVLNSDQKKWLTGRDMNLAPESVCQTAHWANPCFSPHKKDSMEMFGLKNGEHVLLYAGRVSVEKGVLELPDIYRKVKTALKNVRIVIAGNGPAQEQLRKEIPDGIFIDWVEQSKLSAVYSSADLLLLPSKFDTFCNAVLEALSCGLPVVAYNSKGPKDIIINGQCGYLVGSMNEMAAKTVQYLQSDTKTLFRTAAVERAKNYDAEIIISKLLDSVGMNDEC